MIKLQDRLHCLSAGQPVCNRQWKDGELRQGMALCQTGLQGQLMQFCGKVSLATPYPLTSLS